jgi:hypothetical protein
MPWQDFLEFGEEDLVGLAELVGGRRKKCG